MVYQDFSFFCTDSNFDDGRWRNLFISTNVVNYTYDIPNDRKWVYLSLKHDEQAVEILTGVAHHIKSNIGADTYLIPKDCDDENIIGF